VIGGDAEVTEDDGVAIRSASLAVSSSYIQNKAQYITASSFGPQ
jgi:hypothetical protein